jgi:L-fuculose-phosphate aldolase
MKDLIQEIVQISKRLYDRGLIVATDGNVSARLSEDEILITSKGKCKGFLSVDDIIQIPVGWDGLQLPHSELRTPNLEPSSEYRMHLEVYKQRKDINAVVHTHSPFATAYSTTRKPLKPLLAESVLLGGEIPCAEYATPSTEEVPKSISKWIKTHDCVLLANHGVLAIGKSLEEAFVQAERVEFLAKITFLARVFGGEKELTKEEMENLKRLI